MNTCRRPQVFEVAGKPGINMQKNQNSVADFDSTKSGSAGQSGKVAEMWELLISQSCGVAPGDPNSYQSPVPCSEHACDVLPVFKDSITHARCWRLDVVSDHVLNQDQEYVMLRHKECATLIEIPLEGIGVLFSSGLEESLPASTEAKEKSRETEQVLSEGGISPGENDGHHIPDRRIWRWQPDGSFYERFSFRKHEELMQNARSFHDSRTELEVQACMCTSTREDVDFNRNAGSCRSMGRKPLSWLPAMISLDKSGTLTSGTFVLDVLKEQVEK